MEHRNEFLPVPVTPSEKARVEKVAQRLGITEADVFRLAVLKFEDLVKPLRPSPLVDPEFVDYLQRTKKK